MKVLKLNLTGKLAGLIIIFSILFIPSVKSHNLVPFQYPGISGKWGYKDSKTDKVIIYWHFDFADKFDDKGYAKVGLNGFYGFIDTTGEIAVPVQYEELGSKFKNDTLLVRYYSRRLYYYRSNGIVKKYRNGNWLPETYTRVNQIEKILVFKYPKDSAYERELWITQMNILNPKVNTDGMEGSRIKSQERDLVKSFSSLGISSVVANSNNLGNTDEFIKMSYLQINYGRYFGTHNINQPIHFGVGTSYRYSFYYTDSFTYKSTSVSVDLLHRIYLDKGFYFKLGISPVVNSKDVYKSRLFNADHAWKTYKGQQYSLRSYVSVGIGFKIAEFMELQFAYNYIPCPFSINKIQNDYFGYGLQFKF